MIDVAVGIDIGTSYSKAVARAEDGNVVTAYRLASPMSGAHPSRCLEPATAWWTSLKEVTNGLLHRDPSLQLRVVSLCISAIAPTLVVFDAKNLESAYGIPYSWLPDLPPETSFAQCDRRLTDRRLKSLTKVAQREKIVYRHPWDCHNGFGGGIHSQEFCFATARLEYTHRGRSGKVVSSSGYVDATRGSFVVGN